MTRSLILAAISAALLTEAALANPSPGGKGDFLKYLWPSLHSGAKAGRVYYSAACEGQTVPLPEAEVQPPSKGSTGLAAVRSMFRNNRYATVTEDKAGIVRIKIGTVPDAILHTKISTLTISPMDQYDERSAIVAIENTKEVQSSMRRLGIRLPVIPYIGAVQMPISGLPHMPASVTNITMDQALDIVAVTFGNDILYGVCDQSGMFDIEINSKFGPSLYVP